MILNKYDCTKDKVQLYFDHYLDSILISLGFKLSNSGTKYIKEIRYFTKAPKTAAIMEPPSMS